MDVLDGATIFWLIALGMIIGAVAKLAMRQTTIGLIPNLVAGVAGSLIVGSITVLLQLPGGIVFAAVGSLAILFILNVFYQQREAAH